MDWLAGIDPGLLLMVGVFVGMSLLIEGLRRTLTRRETNAEARSRRMRMVAAGRGLGERLDLLAPRPRAVALPGWDGLRALILAAGLPVRPELWLAGMALGAGLGTVAGLRVAGPAVALPLAVAVAVAVPLAVLVALRDRRRDRLVAQLPDALDLMARSLRAGYPLAASIRSVAETMADPIATEFGIVVDQISYGDELVVAVGKLARRVPVEDFRYLAASVAIQHGTGGNLGRVLGVLAQVIRGRAMMRRKIRAMSAEGRISAVILSSIPFLMVGLNSVLTPEYYGGVADHPMFLPLVGVALGLIGINALIMAKLVSFGI